MARIKIRDDALLERSFLIYKYSHERYMITRDLVELPDEVVVDALHKEPDNFYSPDINVESDSSKDSKDYDNMEGTIEAKKNLNYNSSYGTVAKPKSKTKKKTSKKSTKKKSK